jgi:hypothetical protein
MRHRFLFIPSFCAVAALLASRPGLAGPAQAITPIGGQLAPIPVGATSRSSLGSDNWPTG